MLRTGTAVAILSIGGVAGAGSVPGEVPVISALSKLELVRPLDPQDPPEGVELNARSIEPQGPAGVGVEPTLQPDITLSGFPHLPLEPEVVMQQGGAHYYKRVLSSTKPRITRSRDFVRLPGATPRFGAWVPLEPGQAALINVSFSAESRCSEPGSNAQDWCEVRILIDGTEGHPRASSFLPDTFAFDSTDSGTNTVASWEAHTMDRHQCVRNGTHAPRRVPVEVQWKVTNFDGGIPPSFWLDDWSLVIEAAKGCQQRSYGHL